jgi:pimeloyl-ACP methyl ester carboxylesterase
MWLFWIGLLVMCSVPLTVVGWLIGLHYYLRWNYLEYMVRIFQEKPLFVVPRGQPVPGAEDVSFPTSDGLTLKGCYFHAAGRRRGVVLFGLEFGSNRWACVPYCQHLINAGYDVFAFESRNQGDSDRQADYEPLQWVTDYEVEDTRAALRCLKGRPDADPRGIGLFGISKGAGAGLFAAADDPWVRCFVTDGVFATYTVLVPYMRQWFRIYNHNYVAQHMLPSWYYGQIGKVGVRQIERERNCHFPYLERVIGKLAPRPLLMIHGGADTYIKPEMARALFDAAREPKEFWLVGSAKHNQALQVAAGEYERRVREFFDTHLASSPGADSGSPRIKEETRTEVPSP